MLWEDGSKTYKPLDIIAADAPVVCADYAKKNDWLETPGWKLFKKLARREKKLQWMINQAKRKSYAESDKYMFGFQVPKTPKQAYEFDRINGNTKWADAMKLEAEQLIDYKTFIDKGANAKTP